LFKAVGLISKFKDSQIFAEEETPSLPSEITASAPTSLTPRTSAKRKLDAFSMPLNTKKYSWSSKKKKALDHYKFVPESFLEKKSKEKAKCKLKLNIT
jgi:hypothetical protein